MDRNQVSHIHWLGHDSFRIESEAGTIYIDPWKIQGGPDADLVLITHEHHDHCSPEDVEKVQTEDTVIVTIPACAEKLTGDIRTVMPGETLEVRGIEIRTVPAYNLDKFRSPGEPYHPKESGHVGFIITVHEQRIYHTGDTDFIREMEDLQVDVALLPVSGKFVMTAEEAVAAAAALQPKVAIPMHVGGGIGSLDDAQRFQQQASVPVVVLEQEA